MIPLSPLNTFYGLEISSGEPLTRLLNAALTFSTLHTLLVDLLPPYPFFPLVSLILEMMDLRYVIEQARSLVR